MTAYSTDKILGSLGVRVTGKSPEEPQPEAYDTPKLTPSAGMKKGNDKDMANVLTQSLGASYSKKQLPK